jgi:EAL domain-containing protein (putative c-di-GMP-specific phosphodiesterase class I)
MVAGGRRRPRSHSMTPQIAIPAAAIEARLVPGQDYSYAFQPIVDVAARSIFSYEARGPRQTIVRAIMQACIDLGIDVIAEGVETPEEYRWFRNADVTLFQGYLFGRPQFEGLPALQIPIEEYNANSLCE